MTELAALNVRITGDSSALKAAVAAANGDLTKLVAAAEAAGLKLEKGRQRGVKFGQAMDGAAAHTANLTFQLQDIGMMLAAGQSPLMLAMQQGTQVSGIFQQMGASVKTVGPAMAAAFGALLSPLSLITVGTIAVVAALGQWAMSAWSTRDANAALYLEFERQREALEGVLTATENLRLERGMILSGAQLKEEQILLEEINRLSRERASIEERLANTLQFTGNARAAAAKQELEARLASVNVSLQEKQAALDGLNAERQKKTAVEQTFAVADRYRALQERIAGINIAGPWQNVLGSIQAAIGKAQEYAATIAQTQIGGGRGAGPGGPLVGSGQLAELQAGGGQIRNMPVSVPGGGVGGGGGGIASQLQTEIEAMQEALLTQEQLQAESYMRQQETLNQALAQRLITQEEYQRLMQQAQATHDFAMTQSVNKGVTDTLSALGSLFQGSKKIGAAIALANSWVAFTEVLKDPAYVGRPWARIAAAGQALAAGLNAVRNIKGASPGGGGGGGGAGAGISGQAPQQNVQTLNLTFQNDPFGFGQNFARQLVTQLNQASRSGATLIRVGSVN
jgi:hypothetical protein